MTCVCEKIVKVWLKYNYTYVILTSLSTYYWAIISIQLSSVVAKILKLTSRWPLIVDLAVSASVQHRPLEHTQ